MDFIGPAISGVTSLVGNTLGFLSAEASRENQTRMSQAQIDLQRELATRNEYMQQLFASNQLQWKAQDARNAGIHPVFAMGATPFVPSGSSGGGIPLPGDGGGEFLSRMGQDIGRAVNQYSTNRERSQQLELQKEQLMLARDRAMLENERTAAETQLVYSQIARLNRQGQVGPALPSISSGQFPSEGGAVGMRMGASEVKPNEIIAANPSSPFSGAGAPNPYVQWVRSSPGGLRAMPAKPPGGTGPEDEFGAPLMIEFLLDNRFGPYLGSSTMKPPLNVMRSIFGENVKDSYFSRLDNEWKPMFAGQTGGQMAGAGASRGMGIREGLRRFTDSQRIGRF